MGMVSDRGALAASLDCVLNPHRGTLRHQLRHAPGAMVTRLAAVRIVRLMTRANLSVALRRRMFFGSTLSIPFPACWDLEVYGTYIDEAELRLERYMIRALAPGQTVVDVGANVGFFSRLAAELVGPSGRVVAVEPSAAPLVFLHRNLAGVPQAEVAEIALSSEAGRVVFHEAQGAAMVSSSTEAAHLGGRRMRSYEVPATTLDALCAERGLAPDLVKLDVEGGELAVLRGASEVLARHRPDIAMEVEFATYDAGYRQSVELLLGEGYGLFHAEADGRPAPLDPALVLEHGARCDRAHGFLHGLDNLLFLHPDRPRAAA